MLGGGSAAPNSPLFLSSPAEGCLGRFCLPRKLGWVTIDLFPHPRSSEVPVAARLGSDPVAVLNKYYTSRAWTFGETRGVWCLSEIQPRLRDPVRGSLLSEGPFCSWLPVLQARLSVPLFPSCAVGIGLVAS